jgi:hypothetical protein
LEGLGNKITLEEIENNPVPPKHPEIQMDACRITPYKLQTSFFSHPSPRL